MREVATPEKLQAAKACGALLSWLQRLPESEVRIMRDKMRRRRMAVERSRHDPPVRWAPSRPAVVRTSSGCAYLGAR